MRVCVRADGHRQDAHDAGLRRRRGGGRGAALLPAAVGAHRGCLGVAHAPRLLLLCGALPGGRARPARY